MPLPTPPSDQELANAVDQLPPVMSVLWRLLGVLKDPNSDVEDIARLIRVDTALATQVLRLANSPHYGLVERVSSIEEAIQHVGVNEITRLVSTLSSREVFSRSLDHYRVSSTLLWQHTLAVAVGAEVVAGHFLTDAGIAYLAGLLHPIGMVALNNMAIARGLAMRPLDAPLLEWERRYFRDDNAAVAIRVLKYWDFPENLRDAVAARYEPPTAETVGRPGQELYLASWIARRVPAGLPAEAGLFPLPPEMLEEIKLSEHQLAELELEATKRLSQMRALLNLG